LHGERLGANPSSADEWISLTLSNLVSRFKPDDIFDDMRRGCITLHCLMGRLFLKSLRQQEVKRQKKD